MRDKTAIYICILNGILALINPIMGILLFIEGSSSTFIIVTYSSFYAGFSLILAAILAKEDYSLLGVDYVKVGIYILGIAIVIDIIGLSIFNIIIFTNIESPIIISILDFFIYNLIEVITIGITIIIIRKFKNILDVHEHGDEFSH
jgi:hypothetical protein